MTPQEEKIIRLLDSSESKNHITQQIIYYLNNQPLGISSAEFTNHPSLHMFVAKYFDKNEKNYFMLWLKIEDYLKCKETNLLLVEKALAECLTKINPKTKARGSAMFPTEIANAAFIRNIYSIEDKKLSELFLKYLPAPRATLFLGKSIPKVIEEREQVSNKAVINVLQKNDNNLFSVENKIVKVQRKFRAKRRNRENLARLPFRYAELWEDFDSEQKLKESKKLIQEANKSYLPQCEMCYLLSSIKEEKVIQILQEQRKSCILPSWMSDDLNQAYYKPKI